jgi:elongator complex protein 3
LEAVLRAIVDRLGQFHRPSRDDVQRVKIEISKKHRLDSIPGNSEIINVLNTDEAEKLLPILRRKNTRAASGVNVVAVMTEPRFCPHGQCAYCPGGPEKNVPQSYTGYEPATMRGAQNEYDPYLQVMSRLKQMRAIGHEVDKVDLIIMGGTFPAAPYEYQCQFVKGCLEALIENRTSNLLEAKTLAESSKIRNVGITVETRPDLVDETEIGKMLDLGVTRVELGVQNVYNDIYNLVDRGHTVEDVVNATRLLKDSGLKVCYHMMPGLPGSNKKRDLKGFKQIFDDRRFRPDMMKIYPTLVIEGTKLHSMWTKGTYKPLTTDEATELISEIKTIIPPWHRIMRIQRDIPSPLIIAGVKKSNLRQLVQNRLKEKGKFCHCIRCREIGHKETGIDPDELKIIRRTYEASNGIENFISVETPENDILVGFMRMRIPSEKAFRREIEFPSVLLRELHIYGNMVPVGDRHLDAWQHKGWGGVLMSEIEGIAVDEYDAKKLLVMSALGTKRYYMKLGYKKDGAYVSKPLKG